VKNCSHSPERVVSWKILDTEVPLANRVDTGIVTTSGPIATFTKNFAKRIKSFVTHEFVRSRMRQRLHTLRTNMPEDHLIVLVSDNTLSILIIFFFSQLDYSENFQHLKHREIQKDFFKTKHSTILPIIVQFRVNGVLQTHSHLCISDTFSKGPSTTHSFLVDILKHYNVGTSYKHVHVWSDGSSGQFKQVLLKK